MLSLAYANRMEVLLAPLAARIAEAQEADPFSPIELIVPNRSVAQLIRLELAERLGVAANLEFHFLRRFFVRAVEATGEVRVLNAQALQVLLFHQLLDPEQLEDPILAPVRDYLAQGEGAAEWSGRALQLSGHLARLFEEYALHRRTMIEGWYEGRLLQEPTHIDAERWQRALWLRVFDERGRLRGVETPDGIPWALLPDAVTSIHPFALKTPRQLHLIGFSYLAPVYAELLAHVALGTEMCVYTLNPCLEFWEDVDSGIEARREGWARHRERVLNLDALDPFNLDEPTDTPALRLWGRPGREFIRLLNELTDCDFLPLFVEPSAGIAKPGLLHALQGEVLVRAPERPAAPEGEGVVDDGSVRFLACPSPRREAEIVADQIWSLISEDDAEGGDLRFHEIAILVTEHDREAYLTHLEAVFQERFDIPLNIIDRRLSSQSRVLEAIHRLLMMPTGRMSVSELLPLLTHPNVLNHVAVNTGRWRRWCEDLNIRFGADRSALEGTYIDADVYHWDQGLRRLALGAFMVGERFGEQRAYSRGEDAWLPFDTPPDAAADVARLTALARGLIRDAEDCVDASLSLTGWSILFTRLVKTYVHPRGVEDERAMSQALRALERLSEIDLEGLPLDFETARALALSQLNSLESHRGQHQADGVVVAALEPMRPIPYRVIFAMGLGEGIFPKPNHDDPLDLRRARRRAGDVTPSERDRYLFLETLLSARERLYLSYVSVDSRTGEPLEPSALIRELQYILRGHVDRATLERMTLTWPRSAYEPRCYPLLDPEADPALESVSRAGYAGAQAAALRDHLEAHLTRRPPEHEALLDQLSPATSEALAPLLQLSAPPDPIPEERQRVELPLSALLRFLESPLQGSAQRLGLSDEEVRLLHEAEDEPLSAAMADRFAALKEAFWAGGGDPAATEAAWRKGFARRVLKGEAPVGPFAKRRVREDLKILDTWLANLTPFPAAQGGWISVALGRAQEHESVDQQLPALQFDIPLPDGTPRRVSLYGATLRIKEDCSAALNCLRSKRVEERRFLPGFLTAAALSAAGAPMQSRIHVCANPTELAPPTTTLRTYRVPPPKVAYKWLKTLIAELLAGVHPYRLPIEVALAHKDELHWRRHIPISIPATRRTSDDHGPIEAPHRFDPPPPDQVPLIIQRRLGPWLEALI